MSWVSETDLVVWQQGGIACAVVSASVGFDVELRNSQGVAFLRKSCGYA